MATIAERWQGTTGDLSSRRIRYLVKDAKDDKDALDVVRANAPTTYDGIPRANVSVEELRKPTFKLADPNGTGTSYPVADDTKADGVYYAEAEYNAESMPAASTGTGPDEADPTTWSQTLSFETSLNEELILTPPLGLDDVADGGSWVAGQDLSGFTPTTYTKPQQIGYKGIDRGYEGIQRLKPDGSFQLSWYPANTKIDVAKRDELLGAVGCTNDADYWGYPAGSVLCFNVNGQARSETDWNINAVFVVKKEQTVTIVPDDSAPVQATLSGWDHLDVETEQFGVVGWGTHEQASKWTVWRLYERKTFSTVFDFS